MKINYIKNKLFTLCVENLTRPKDPVPNVTPTSKSSRHIGVGSVRTCGSVIIYNWIYFY